MLRADGDAVRLGAPGEVHGAPSVATLFSGRALAAQRALVDGVAAVVWAPGGTLRGVISITVVNGRIAAIEMVANPERLRQLDVIID
jgi:RNA polymerase sigma-70 factor (ECF subfamily)